MRLTAIRLLTLAVLAALALSACVPRPTPTLTAPTSAPVAPSQTPAPSPSPTPASRALVVCQAQEPASLYLYGGLGASAWNVLEAIYDGPIDRSAGQDRPVILQALPALSNGGVVIEAVDVVEGQEVQDAHGDIVSLAAGTLVRPAGCDSVACAAAWDGRSPLKMDRVTATFTLLPDLKWSDGQPLTAADSAFSYSVAADPASQAPRAAVDRTDAYRATDDLTIVWSGKPGVLNADLTTYFWSPLPRHVLGSTPVASLPASEAAALKPLGWGPYMIDEWTAGDHITLKKNPHYFRAGEGLPKFDTLVYRFIQGGADALLTALQAGECDIVDRSARLEDALPALRDLTGAGKAQVFTAAGPEWEQLVFGIKPASYDDGYNPAVDRVDFFGDARARRAFAYCIDRQMFVDSLKPVLTAIPASYLPATDPQAESAAPTYAYDPAEGGKLLDEVGWKDSDGDPVTPRVAQGVKGVPDGTPLSVSLLTPKSGLRNLARASMAQTLGQCGIQVQGGEPADMGALFAEGPDGPVFGRKFDLVQLSWQAGAQPQCYLYESWRIPNAANQWIGTNIAGYANPEYDAACQAALGIRADKAVTGQAQVLFAQELPSIPLYLLPHVVAARPELCGYTPNGSARSDLPGLETLDYGPACGK